ncbi:MAG: hypothetical protein H6839_07385 [Planctomycetes bacterium]|nr:hypothetical protein [Planctomycetota bacterium]
MRNTWKLLPLAVLAVMLFGCGGGGGTATPDDIGKSVVSAVKSENFDSLYSLLPHQLEDPAYDAARREYRIKEGYERWKDVKDTYLGNKEKGVEALDPEEKSGIKDEDSWKSATPERLYATDTGAYQIYKIKKFEDRVTNAEFYWRGTNINSVKPGEEDRRTASVRFSNIYGDSIVVSCIEDQGLWYMISYSLRFAEELPKPPED